MPCISYSWTSLQLENACFTQCFEDPAELLHRKELIMVALEMICQVVICEAQTKHIIGGDRDEDKTLMASLLAKFESSE